MDLTGKRCLIFGNGVSGKGVLKRVEELNGKGFFYNGGSFNRRDYDFCVISPYMSIYSDEYALILSKGLPLFSEPDFAFLCGTDTSMAVTGTNGKTTVVRYIEQITEKLGIECKGIGNIGYPMSIYRGENGVCEISSFMLEQSSYFKCDYSVITNIQPDHLDRHRSYEEYVRQKLKIYKLTRKGIAISLNCDFYSLAPKEKILIEYSLKGESMLYCEGDKLIYNEGCKTVLYEGEGIPKGYELENLLQALSLCIMKFGVNHNYSNCFPLKKDLYRMQYMGVIKGKKVYNDSKGTNISATLAGLKSLNGSTLLIVGGYDKGENYTRLIRELGDTILYIVGGNGYKIAQTATELGYKYVIFNSLKECVKSAFECNCDNILYSPSCASFDYYKSYEERGRRFNEILQELS